jgi:hypothetical protein
VTTGRGPRSSPGLAVWVEREVHARSPLGVGDGRADRIPVDALRLEPLRNESAAKQERVDKPRVDGWIAEIAE